MYYTPYICHYGVKGQKWGIRRSIKRASTNAKRIGKNTVNYIKKNKKQIAKVATKSALKAKTWAKNNKTLLLTTAYVAGAAFVNTFVSSAAGSIRAQAYRATHGEEYWQGTEVIRGLNLMA